MLQGVYCDINETTSIQVVSEIKKIKNHNRKKVWKHVNNIFEILHITRIKQYKQIKKGQWCLIA